MGDVRERNKVVYSTPKSCIFFNGEKGCLNMYVGGLFGSFGISESIGLYVRLGNNIMVYFITTGIDFQ